MSKSHFIILLSSAVVLAGAVCPAGTIAAVPASVAKDLFGRGRAEEYTGDDEPSVIVDDDNRPLHADIEAHDADRAEQDADNASGATAANDAANAAAPKVGRGNRKAK